MENELREEIMSRREVGMNNKEIALDLGISRKQVEHYTRTEKPKLDDLMKLFDPDYKLHIQKPTSPSQWRKDIVCIENCDICPLALKGCAKNCNRYWDFVCRGCPCVNHPVVNKKHIKHNSKFTKPDIEDIRGKYKPNVYTAEMLAYDYGTDEQTIQKILSKKNTTRGKQ